MRQVGADSFEITNKKTGETRVVSGADLPKYGLSKPFNLVDTAPAVGGTIGALAGSIGGPVGAGLGAAVGTAGGHVVKDILTPKYSDELTGKTKVGLPELSAKGREISAQQLGNAAKESAISGVSTYIAGKGLELGGKLASKVGSKIVDKQNIIDTIVKASQTTKKATDKVSLTKKLVDDINTAARSNPTKVDYGKLLNRIIERANTELSGNVREAVIKNAAKEKPGMLDLVKAIAKKRGAGYLPNAKAATAKFNELLRQELKSEIHNVAPDIAKMDEAYSVIASGSKSVLNTLKKLGIPALGVFGASKVLGK